MSRIRLLLAEDHQVVREGLRALLREAHDLEVVGEASDGLEAIQLAERAAPDVVVMDLGLPGVDGIEATRRIRAARPTTQVVILSMRDDAVSVERALRAGALAYVLKGDGVGRLCDAIRAVRRGERYLSDEVQSYAPGQGPPSTPLSEREREVLALIAEGLTGREIAERLGLRPKTVENHRARIMEKLDIHTTAGLVRYAVAAGLVRA